jgi:hypothetical protein
VNGKYFTYCRLEHCKFLETIPTGLYHGTRISIKDKIFAFCWHCLQSQCYLVRVRREVAIKTVLADDWAMHGIK